MNKIALSRLQNQQIISSEFSSAKELVKHFGAIQAQDYAMAKWAVGLRVLTATDESIVNAINNAEIIRTHVLRPTWHLVAASEIRWMLDLSAPNILKLLNHHNKKLELNEEIFIKASKIIEKILLGKELTREEIMVELNAQNIQTNPLRASHIMFYAELTKLVCNGKRKGKQFTYSLMDEKIPIIKSISKDEALTKLAFTFFNSHGFATLKDFIWWSGLSVTDAKKGLENAKYLLQKETINGNDYWCGNDYKASKITHDGIHFLPAFDEYLISYKDRTALIHQNNFKNAFTNNGIFKPIIIYDGQTIGTWKRIQKKEKVIIETYFFENIPKIEMIDLLKAANKYADFLQMNLEIKSN